MCCRALEIDQLSDIYKLTLCTDSGCILLKDTNTIYDEIHTELYTIKDGEPSTAKVTIQGQIVLKIEGESTDERDVDHERLDTRVQALSEMWSDEEFFYLKSQLTAWHNDEACFDKTWTKKIERFYV